MTSEGVHVVVDTREPGDVVAAVDGCRYVKSWTLDHLPAGDLLIGGVLFERKTWADYASALTGKSGRTWDEQVRKLTKAVEAEEIEAAYVLIDGDLHDAAHVRSNINAESLRGSAASVTAREGLPVIPCSNTDLLVDHAVRLARKHTEGPTTTKGLKASAVASKEPPVLRMYGCLPGVGPKTARALYNRFPNFPELVAATPDLISRTEGIGETRAEAIYDAIRNVREEEP